MSFGSNCSSMDVGSSPAGFGLAGGSGRGFAGESPCPAQKPGGGGSGGFGSRFSLGQLGRGGSTASGGLFSMERVGGGGGRKGLERAQTSGVLMFGGGGR